MIPGSVVIAEASQIACQLVATALKRSRYKFTVLGMATDSSRALSEIIERQPQVASISLHLQDGPMKGLDVLRELRASRQKTHSILVVDAPLREVVLAAFRNSAHGVFHREQSVQSFCKCIHSVAQGQVWANSQEMHYLLEALSFGPSTPAFNSRVEAMLTRTELAIARLVAQGLKNREVAQRLDVTEHTVRNHLFRIFDKLGMSSRVELVIYCLSAEQQSPQATPPETPASSAPRKPARLGPAPAMRAEWKPLESAKA